MARLDGRVAIVTGAGRGIGRSVARLLASEGALVAVSEVPEGVRDVLRRRLARLPPPAVAPAWFQGRRAETARLAGIRVLEFGIGFPPFWLALALTET